MQHHLAHVRICHLDAVGNSVQSYILILHLRSSHFIVDDYRYFFPQLCTDCPLSFSIDIWNMNEKTQALHLRTDYQHKLLRDMAVQDTMMIQVTSQSLLTNQHTCSSMIN